ncbi:MAG: carboxypeptidase regulatory-like domain-containing protein [Burkholderiales bacterium]|nr:T9SS type A sorting domain-containing protein [Burkholderiales bacterium]MDE1928969.1 carboxypeptidase regulatory-like domain-containing protein [Burkholderiales bacterium]MDE2158323.1 carboxypeptidase regulatory-like domain-containing protein [Burkholderiales bacterium]MDE2501418.1 carboxypeptidase regulatory-like domain-containing protein [Burkholderiales bacterium]
MKTRILPTLIVAACAALPLAAPAAGTLPPVHKQGGVSYLSGGIGDGQAAAIKAASPHWPLTLLFAVRTGRSADYLANVQVTVHDAQGRVVLETTADGPYLLAQLAPGAYQVDATVAGKTLARKVKVNAGHPVRAVFVWPEGTDDSGS